MLKSWERECVGVGGGRMGTGKESFIGVGVGIGIGIDKTTENRPRFRYRPRPRVRESMGTVKESMWEGREGLMIAHSGFGDRKHLGIPHSARVKVFDGKTHLVIAPHQIAPFQMKREETLRIQELPCLRV